MNYLRRLNTLRCNRSCKRTTHLCKIRSLSFHMRVKNMCTNMRHSRVLRLSVSASLIIPEYFSVLKITVFKIIISKSIQTTNEKQTVFKVIQIFFRIWGTINWDLNHKVIIFNYLEVLCPWQGVHHKKQSLSILTIQNPLRMKPIKPKSRHFTFIHSRVTRY